jgi:anaerobic magnesium-protoporphyrin IX monomethyl ester cyclase
MNKKILFVVPIRSRYNVPAIDMGLLYLASAVRRVGWEPQILHCGIEEYSYQKFASFVRSNHFDVIGFKCLSYDFASLQKHARIIRTEQPETTIIMGGPHPSALPRESLESSPDFDFVWHGEGEIGLPMLLERFTEVKAGESKVLREIPGLVWRDAGAVVCNKPVFVEDLSSLGMPAWDLINPLRFPDTTMGGRYVPITTTRGCPFLCTYCSAFTVAGRKIRFRSIDSIIEELKYLIREYGIRKFSIIDDNFTFNNDFALGLCERIKSENLDISWDCGNGVRLDSMTPELVRAMEAAGCYSVSLGIESGSQRILNLLRKRLTLETIREKVALIKSNSKIRMTGFHLIGYLGETVAEIKQTIRLACELPLNKANFSLVMPLPGTEIWYELIKQGLLDPNHVDWNKIYSDTLCFRRPGISQSQLLGLQREAYLSFYLRPRIIKGLVKQVLSSRNMHRALLRKAMSVFFRK